MKNILSRIFNRNKQKEVLAKKNESKIDSVSNLIDLLYLDNIRLNLYFDQLFPNNKTEELLAVKTTLGLTKAETEMVAQEHVVEVKPIEKVSKIIDKYKADHPTYYMDTNLNFGFRESKFMYFENIPARQIIFPIKKTKITDKNAINIWVSFCKHYNLYAIEDKKNIFTHETNYFSSYSILEFLNSSSKNSVEISEPRIMSMLGSLDKAAFELTKIGGAISQEKSISLLCRQRLVYHDNLIGVKQNMGFICYPILITG